MTKKQEKTVDVKKSPDKKVTAGKPVVEKKSVVKTPEKKLAYPVTDLHAPGLFVAKWIWAGIPTKIQEPKDGEFAFILVYRLVRDLASAQGKDYQKMSVYDLMVLLVAYADTHPDTVVGKWVKGATPNQKRSLRARLQWCMVSVLAVDGAQKTVK